MSEYIGVKSMPISYDSKSGKVEANLWVMGCEKYWDEYWGEYDYETFGAEIILAIQIDEKGNAKASKTEVVEIRSSVNW